ncbi:MAG: HAD-IA family hydrolase [Lysobacterales bacterium]
MIKAVLFDLDGTLLDSAPDLVATLNHLRAGLNLAAMPMDDLRHFASRGAMGLIKAGMPPCDNERLHGWKDAFIDHYQENSYVQSRPFDGVEPLLAGLRDRHVPWGVVTNKLEFLCLPILEKAGWLSLVSVLICGDTVANSNPHPALVLEACKKLAVDPENTLLVGDDPRDMKAGKLAGCQTAFALYGYADKESRFEITESTTLVNTPQEVLEILDSSGTR